MIARSNGNGNKGILARLVEALPPPANLLIPLLAAKIPPQVLESFYSEVSSILLAVLKENSEEVGERTIALIRKLGITDSQIVSVLADNHKESASIYLEFMNHRQ